MVKKKTKNKTKKRLTDARSKEWRKEYQLLYRLCQVPELGWELVNKAKAGNKVALNAIAFYATSGHRKSAVLLWVDQQWEKLRKV